MMSILAALLRRNPTGYGRRVNVRYEETRVFEGYLKTGDQLFTNERIAARSLVYHVLAFELDGLTREFLVNDNDRQMHLEKGAHLPGLSQYRC